jgi:NAD(P)-dependent dehydrogenase (short-subunit alcohol dehydrogenase family)
MQLGGKVALITGAGSGIGRAAALLMAREGARIAALDQTGDDLAETVAAITQAGGAALPLAADVGDPDQMDSAVQALIAHFGRLDIVFANAGINGVWAPLEELSPADWTHTINTNLTGTFLTVKYAVPYLKRQGGAVIITSSVNGTRNFSNTGATAYSCAKAAQVAFAKMVALELARDQVRVNVICPGWIATNIEQNTEQRHLEEVKIPVEYPAGSQPLTGDKPGSAEQVAQLVLVLASDAADHITGTEMWIDGGASLLQG